MGAVYKAIDVKANNRPVAIKILLSDQEVDQNLLDRFKREGELAATTKHRHIVGAYELFEDNNRLHLVLEFIEGKDLKGVIKEYKKRPDPHMPLDEVSRYITQISDALDYIHSRGIVHRDLKPENVMVEEGTLDAKLTDFGLAKVKDDDGLTMSNTCLGTPKYWAPEILDGESKHATAQTDIYTLAAMATEMVSGEPIVNGNTLAEICNRIIKRDYNIIAKSRLTGEHKLPKKIVTTLDAICAKGLKEKPKKRYETAGQFAEDFNLAVNGKKPIYLNPSERTHSRKSSLRIQKYQKQTLPKHYVGGIAAAAVLGLSIGFGALFSSGNNDTTENIDEIAENSTYDTPEDDYSTIPNTDRDRTENSYETEQNTTRNRTENNYETQPNTDHDTTENNYETTPNTDHDTTENNYETTPNTDHDTTENNYDTESNTDHDTTENNYDTQPNNDHDTTENNYETESNSDHDTTENNYETEPNAESDTTDNDSPEVQQNDPAPPVQNSDLESPMQVRVSTGIRFDIVDEYNTFTAELHKVIEGREGIVSLVNTNQSFEEEGVIEINEPGIYVAKLSVIKKRLTHPFSIQVPFQVNNGEVSDLVIGELPPRPMEKWSWINGKEIYMFDTEIPGILWLSYFRKNYLSDFKEDYKELLQNIDDLESQRQTRKVRRQLRDIYNTRTTMLEAIVRQTPSRMGRNPINDSYYSINQEGDLAVNSSGPYRGIDLSRKPIVDVTKGLLEEIKQSSEVYYQRQLGDNWEIRWATPDEWEYVATWGGLVPYGNQFTVSRRNDSFGVTYAQQATTINNLNTPIEDISGFGLRGMVTGAPLELVESDDPEEITFAQWTQRGLTFTTINNQENYRSPQLSARYVLAKKE